MPYGDLVRSGATVTYGSDIPGVDIPEIPPLIQIEALLTRQRPGYPDDIPLVPRQRIGLRRVAATPSTARISFGLNAGPAL